MFRKMRRNAQELPREEALAVLENGSTGILAVLGDGGYPYTVPLNYALMGGNIYFHCAPEGHKLDAIKKNGKVSFCVVGKDEVIAPIFSTDYRSAIAFGRARVVTEDGLKREALVGLAEKYGPDYMEAGREEIKSTWDRVVIVEIKVEHLTGKEAGKRVKSFMEQGK